MQLGVLLPVCHSRAVIRSDLDSRWVQVNSHTDYRSFQTRELSETFGRQSRRKIAYLSASRQTTWRWEAWRPRSQSGKTRTIRRTIFAENQERSTTFKSHMIIMNQSSGWPLLPVAYQNKAKNTCKLRGLGMFRLFLSFSNAINVDVNSAITSRTHSTVI